MASYLEIKGLFTDSELHEKVEAAIVIAAAGLITGTETAEQARWAAKVFTSPSIEAKKALMGVLALNSSATIEQIKGATDSAIQTNVNTLVPALVTAGV